MHKDSDYASIIQALEMITVNSRVSIIDLDSLEEFTFTLVPYNVSNDGKDEVSISTSLGSALLYHQIGHIIKWQAPSRLRRFQVKAVE